MSAPLPVTQTVGRRKSIQQKVLKKENQTPHEKKITQTKSFK